MTERSLSKQLLVYLQENKHSWIHKGHITRMEWKNKKNRSVYLPDTVGRTLRDLAAGKLTKEPVVAVKKPEGSCMYKFIPDDIRMLRKRYIFPEDRTSDKEMFKKIIN